MREYGPKAFVGNGQRRVEEGRIAELERQAGRQRSRSIFTAILAERRGEAEAAGIDYPHLIHAYFERSDSGDAIPLGDSAGWLTSVGPDSTAGMTPVGWTPI